MYYANFAFFPVFYSSAAVSVVFHFALLFRFYHLLVVVFRTRGQSNFTKSASRGAHSPVRGHPRGSKVVPLNSWGRVSY